MRFVLVALTTVVMMCAQFPGEPSQALAAATVTSTVTVGNAPEGLGVDAANGDVYVANQGSNTVSVIDGSTNTVTSTITVGSHPFDVAYDAANGDMYVANELSGTVSVIDGSTNTVTSTITVGGYPVGVAYDAVNGDVYVTNGSISGTVSVIDGSTNTVTNTIPVGNAPFGVAYNAANGDVYVANSGSNTVSVIDGSTNTVTSTIPVGGYPQGVAYDAANGDVYVANYSNNSQAVSVIDGSTNQAMSTIPVGSDPFFVSYGAAYGDVYVTNANSAGTVSVIDGSTNTVTSTITVGSVPTGVAYDVTNGNVYVANGGAGSVSVIVSSQSLSYSGNGATSGSVPNGSNPAYKTAVTVAGNTGNLQRKGYTFAGWNTKADGSGTSYSANSTLTMPATNVTLYAQWTVNTYFLSYDGNGSTSGSVPSGSNPAYNTTVTVAGNTGNLQKTGYTFTGWNTKADGSGTSYSTASTLTMGTSNITLYAQWTVNTYSLSYDGNGSTSGSVPSGSNPTYNTTVTVAGNTGNLQRKGYTFAGWNTKADGSGTSYSTGSTLTIGASNITLYAQWTVNTYSLSYDGNGSTSGSVPSGSNPAYNTTVTVAGNTGNLQKTGYTFAGWNTKADGSGTSYFAGSTLTTGTSNITLYAQWLPNPAGLQHQNVTQTGWTENWTAVSGASSYDVYLNNNKVGTVTQAVYDFTGQQPGTTYQVQVSSVNSSGQASVLSAPDSVTTTVYRPIPPTIITEFFPEPAQVGQAYSGQVRVIGGTIPMKWSITTGTLPPGLTLSNQGVISGTPNSAGSYNFTVKVTDSHDLASSRQLTIVVNGSSTLSIKTATVIPVWHPGRSFKQPLTAVGGNPPYTWSIVKGTLPSGLKLNPSTGVVSGITTRKSPEILTVEVMDATGTTEEKQVVMDSVPISEREIVLATASLFAQNVPAVTGSDSGTQTTYMPIWYVMQLLKPLGITSTWDGTNWRMATASQLDLSNLNAGKGTTTIYLNGTVLQNVNTVAATDPSTGKATTYMPIWYVMQVLQHLGMHSTWDGTTWTMTK
ncbi:InlB B-repeat-containing protein [Alicyclobacillus curvatus]|nr:InlB B-repeat-containing protein [Alicyclobacillus curvatus]